MDLNKILEFLEKFKDTDKIGEVKEYINKMIILEEAKCKCPDLTGKYVKETFEVRQNVLGDKEIITDLFKIKAVEVDNNGNYLNVIVEGNTIRKYEAGKEYSILSENYWRIKSISIYDYKEKLTVISKNEYDSELGRAIKYFKNGYTESN